MLQTLIHKVLPQLSALGYDIFDEAEVKYNSVDKIELYNMGRLCAKITLVNELSHSVKPAPNIYVAETDGTNWGIYAEHKFTNDIGVLSKALLSSRNVDEWLHIQTEYGLSSSFEAYLHNETGASAEVIKRRLWGIEIPASEYSDEPIISIGIDGHNYVYPDISCGGEQVLFAVISYLVDVKGIPISSLDKLEIFTDWVTTTKYYGLYLADKAKPLDAVMVLCDKYNLKPSDIRVKVRG